MISFKEYLSEQANLSSSVISDIFANLENLTPEEVDCIGFKLYKDFYSENPGSTDDGSDEPFSLEEVKEMVLELGPSLYPFISDLIMIVHNMVENPGGDKISDYDGDGYYGDVAYIPSEDEIEDSDDYRDEYQTYMDNIEESIDYINDFTNRNMETVPYEDFSRFVDECVFLFGEHFRIDDLNEGIFSRAAKIKAVNNLRKNISGAIKAGKAMIGRKASKWTSKNRNHSRTKRSANGAQTMGQLKWSHSIGRGTKKMISAATRAARRVYNSRPKAKLYRKRRAADIKAGRHIVRFIAGRH